MRVRRVEFATATVIHSQGDPCATVLNVDQGAVSLSVVPHAGKEAVIADVQSGHVFGEGCLAGQPVRMSTATATSPCATMVMDRQEVVRLLHERHRSPTPSCLTWSAVAMTWFFSEGPFGCADLLVARPARVTVFLRWRLAGAPFRSPAWQSTSRVPDAGTISSCVSLA